MHNLLNIYNLVTLKKSLFLKFFQGIVLGTIVTIFVEAFATHDWQIYVGSLPGIATNCIMTLARSMITKLVGSSEIGKVLAVTGCIQVRTKY